MVITVCLVSVMSPAMTQSSFPLFGNISNGTNGETGDESIPTSTPTPTPTLTPSPTPTSSLTPTPDPTPSPSPAPTPTPTHSPTPTSGPTPTLTPAPTPTPFPVPITPPTITSFTHDSPVYDVEGATRTFNITTEQVVNVSWLLNGTEVQIDTSVIEALYTNTSPAVGIWNVSAIASNENGTDMHTWIWNVSGNCTINVTGCTKNKKKKFNESNNSMNIFASYTDLAVTGIEIETGCGSSEHLCYRYEGYVLNVTARIENLGAANASDFVVKFYDDDSLFFNESILSLSTGDLQPVNASWDLSNASSVSHTITVKIDPCDNSDSNSTNNIKNITVGAKQWKVKILSCPTSAKEGNVTINVSVENLNQTQDGNISLNFSYLGMYKGALLYDTETLFNSTTVHVDAHSTNYIEVIWNARPLFIGPPNNITTSFMIFVEAPKEGIIDATPINVELSNLSITNMTLNPSHPAYGDTVNVNITVENNENETVNATLWLYVVNTTAYEIGYSPKPETLTLSYPGALNMDVHFFDEITYYEAGPGCWYEVHDKDGNLIMSERRSSPSKKTEPIDVWTKWGAGDTITLKYYRIEATIGSAALLESMPVTLNPTETKNFSMRYNFSQPGVHTLWVILSNGNKANKTVGGADLAVELLVNETVLDGDQLNITTRIKNLGHENATNFTVYFYNDSLSAPFHEESIPFLSGVDYPDSTTTIYTTWNATTWNAGEGEEGKDTFNHTIKVEIDPCGNIDSDKLNDDEERTIRVYKDFTVTNLTIFPDVNVSIGGIVTINSTIEYLGNRSCSVDVCFYVNKSGDKKRLINSSILYFNASGEGAINWTADIDETINLTVWSTNVSTSWTADIGGNCAIRVEVDPTNEIWEVNEKNNSKRKSIHINAPDFVVENLHIEPESPIEGNTTNLTAIVKNTGDLPVTVNISFYDNIRESMGCVNSISIHKDEKDSEQKPITVKRLEVQSRDNTVAMRIHFDFTNESEEGYLRIYDSKGRLVASYNESFNGWTSWIFGNRTIAEIEKPEGSSGSYVSVNVDKYDYLVPEDEIYSSHSSINATDVQNITINWTATPAGEHLIVAIVDPEDVIPEINETNNVQLSFILVQGPDLVISNIWLLNNTDGIELNATNITAGELVNITANITNRGVLPAYNFNVSFFLNDYYNKIAAIPVLNLSPNKAINVSAKWAAAVGNHTIIVNADSENDIFETNESNNSGETWAKVLGADLAVNITFNTTADEGNAIITANATIINQGVLPANNFSSFLFLGRGFERYEDDSGHDIKWMNKSLVYTGANYSCVYINRTWDKDKDSSEVDKGSIMIFDKEGKLIAEPTKPCWILVEGDTVNVSVLQGDKYVEMFLYAGNASKPKQNISLDVEEMFNFSLSEEVGEGIYMACVYADEKDEVPEHDEDNNIEVREIKVLPDCTVANISIMVNGTEVQEVEVGEKVQINVSIKNEGLIRGVADVEVFAVHDWVDLPPRFELTPHGYPYGYGYGYVITHPGADAIRIHFETLNVVTKNAPGNETRGFVYIKDEKGKIRDEWRDNRRGAMNSSWITGDTAYVYAPAKCGDISSSKVIIDKYQWVKRIANFSGLMLQVNETKNIPPFEWNPDDAGAHIIRVIVDQDNEVEEINESNNELNRTFYVVPCEDPAVINITLNPELPLPGERVDITACITNYGNKTANFSVDLWALKEEDYYYETVHPTDDFSETITTYPEANWTGIHFEKIRLDEGSITRRMKVDDSHNNTNTSAYFHSFNGEDLWTWVKGNAAEIEMLPFDSQYDHETTETSGGRSVWGCRVDKVAHKIIFNHTIASLGAGNSTNVTGVLSNMRAGNGSLSYTIYACVDRDNVLYEMNESNNEMIKVLNTAIPDLTVSDIKCEGGHPEAEIENIGYAPANNVTVRFIRDVVDYSLEKVGKSGTYSESIPENLPENAVVMRVHVKKLYVDDGGYLNISNGTFWEKYEKNKENFWSSWMGVDPAKYSNVTLEWGNATRLMSFEIDKYEYGVDKPDKPIENFYAGMEREEEVPFTVENEVYNLTVFVDPEDRVVESNEGNNKEEKRMGPDLTIEKIDFYNKNDEYVTSNKLIAREPHKIKVEVKNEGCVPAVGFDVALYVNKSYNATYSELIPGFPVRKTTSRLDPGVSREEDFPWTPMEDGFYRVKVVVDEDKKVRELNEENNICTSEEVKAGEPGYRAKLDPLKIYKQDTLNGGIIYEIGNRKYEWPDPYKNKSYDYSVDFNINLPENATIELARLYSYVAGDKRDPEHHSFLLACQPGVSMKFNSISVDNKKTTYEDISGATNENYSYMTYCYNVKDACDGENWHAEAHFERKEKMRFGIDGMALLVVYRDNDALVTSYWIGEGSDVIMAKNMKFFTGFKFDECERKCVFEGVTDAQKANASLLTVLSPWASYDPYSLGDNSTLCSEAGEKGDRLHFEEQEVGSLEGTSHWKYKDPTKVALTENEWESVRVKEGPNTAVIQSRGNYFTLTNAILNVTYPPDLVKPNLPKSVVVGKSIPVVIRNTGKSKAKDFNVSFEVDGVFKGKEHVNVVEGEKSTELTFPWTPLAVGQVVRLNVSVDSEDDVKNELNENNNNISQDVAVVPMTQLKPGGKSISAWKEGLGPGEGLGEGAGAGTTAGTGGKSAMGEKGGKAITGRLMKGTVAQSEEGGGGKVEFSILGLLMRLAVLAAAVVLVCAGYLLERRRQKRKQ